MGLVVECQAIRVQGIWLEQEKVVWAKFGRKAYGLCSIMEDNAIEQNRKAVIASNETRLSQPAALGPVLGTQ